MKTKYYHFFLLGAVITTFLSCDEKAQILVVNEPIQDELTSYDSTLAAKLGSDNYGMKTYMMAF